MPTIGHNSRPGEKPPVEPIAALAHTPAGAKAFAVFFIKTIDWGYATTSSTYMRHYFQQSCIECKSIAAGIAKQEGLHHHFVGDRITGISVRRVIGPNTLLLHFSITAGEVLTRKNKFVDGEPAIPNYTESITLSPSAGGWSIKSMVPKS